MPEGPSHNGHAALSTATEVTRDLVDRHRQTGTMFRAAVAVCAVLFVLGIVGFVVRLTDGVADKAVWGYYAALFAFILTTAQAAPLVAIAPRIANAHWRRPISRAAELFTAVGLLNLLLFIPLLWVLPSLEDGRRTLWFYDPADPELMQVPVYSPHIWSTLALLGLVAIGLALLWVSALPDLATLRDRSEGRRRRVLEMLAHGWNGSSARWHWQRHRLGILGALYFMMLVFVHFMISVDFAMALVPGWIDALFPATQAHNALQAGVATVLITMFLLRRFGGYGEYIGLDQFWGLGKLLLALSLLWVWFWFSSFIVMWYGKKPNEVAVLELLMVGPYLPVFMAGFLLNFVVPFFVLVWNPVRKSIWGPTIIAVGVLIGSFLDRARIYAASYSVAGAEDKHELQAIPAAKLPDFADVLIWVGAIAGSVLVYLLMTKVIPPVNIWEQRELLLYKIHKPFHRTEVLVLGKPE